MIDDKQVQIKDKFCLTIEEASAYFNIGEKKLRKIVSDNLDSGFIIQNGVKFLVKRKQFEKFLDDPLSVLLKLRIEKGFCLWYNLVYHGRALFV